MTGAVAALVAVRVLHVASGMIWVGGQAILLLAVFPVLQSGRSSRSILRAVGARAGRVLAPSGAATLVLGIVRAVGWSPLHGAAELVTTAYGVTLLVAFVLTIALAVHGARFGRAMDAALATAPDSDPETIAPETAAMALRGSAVGAAGGGIVLVCMVLLHFGL